MKTEQRKIIATNSCNYPFIVLVYDFEFGINEYVIAKIGNAFNDSLMYVESRPTRKYKIYHGEYRSYFKWQGKKFYMDETIRC